MAKTTAPTEDQPGQWIISKFGPPSVLKWQTFSSLPEPGQDQALVRIIVAGLAGPDNLQRAGGYPDDRCKEPGFCPGYDFVGAIEKIGSSSAGLSSGDLVTSMCVIGASATHRLIEVSELIPLKKGDDMMKMACLPLNYMTGYGMLFRSEANVRPNMTILIGSVSGGVGTAVAQLAQAFDLNLKMYGTCSKAKFDYVKSLGVTPINRHSPDIVNTIQSLTDGAGVDVVFDAEGSKESIERARKMIKQNGKVVLIAVMASITSGGAGIEAGRADSVFEYIESIPDVSFWGVTWNYYFADRKMFLEDFEKVAQTVRTGKLNPYIGDSFRLKDLIQAHERLASGQNVMGKMLLLVDANLAESKGI